MKTTKKLKLKDFRYLTKDVFNQPLEALVEFCCSSTNLSYWRQDIHEFIRATCCKNTGFDNNDYGNVHFTYQRLLTHLELFYLLMHHYPTWKTSTDNPLYSLTISGYYMVIHDEDMKGERLLKFEKLAEEEVLDLCVFMRRLFKFRSLRSWYTEMDNLMESVFQDEPYPQDNEHAFEVFEQLEKLGEAMFLAYEIRGKEYMLSHCAERFGIKKKKLVDV